MRKCSEGLGMVSTLNVRTRQEEQDREIRPIGNDKAVSAKVRVQTLHNLTVDRWLTLVHSEQTCNNSILLLFSRSLPSCISLSPLSSPSLPLLLILFSFFLFLFLLYPFLSSLLLHPFLFSLLLVFLFLFFLPPTLSPYDH